MGSWFYYAAHGERHLISLPTPNAEWQYLSPLDREISSMNVILIRCFSLQLGSEDGCTRVRRRSKYLIKISHWENSISVDVKPKKKDMTGTLFITLSIALTIMLSMASILVFQYIHNTLQKQPLYTIPLNDTKFWNTSLKKHKPIQIPC